MTQSTKRPPSCFFVLFLLFGLIGTGLVGAFMIWPVVWARLTYAETPCVVLDKRIDQSTGSEGETNYRAQVHIEYTVNGATHRIWTSDAIALSTNVLSEHEAFLARFEKGRSYPCWYDPTRPDRAVLSLRFSWWGLFVLLPLVFVGIGVGGLISGARRPAPPPGKLISPSLGKIPTAPLAGFLVVFFGGFLVAAALAFTLAITAFHFQAPFWLTPVAFFAPFVPYVALVGLAGKRLVARLKRAMPSPERAAALQGSEDSAPASAEQAWPTVPDLEPPRRGRTLAYQLESSTSSIAVFLGALALAGFWNGIVSVFLGFLIAGYLEGKPDWCLTAFLTPFVLIGLVLVAVVVATGWQLLVSLLAGRVRVEIASYRLEPGKSYRFLVEQSGLLSLRQVELTLICTESITHTAGENTSRESKEVVCSRVAGPAPGLEGGLRGSLTVPAQAMHSFDADHNKITWQLVVTGRVGGFLSYRAHYPVIVQPTSREE
jgi:hypothetical protein